MVKVIVLVAGATYDTTGKYLGTAGSGKDELTLRVVAHAQANGKSIDPTMFAAELKAMCSTVFEPIMNLHNAVLNNVEKMLLTVGAFENGTNAGVIKRELGRLRFTKENWFTEKTELTRMMLQLVGTDIARSIDPTVWIRKTWETIQASTSEIAIVSDLRMPNELERMNFACELVDSAVRPVIIPILVRRTVEASASTAVRGVEGHYSEAEFPITDGVIVVDNNGSLEQLQEAIDAILPRIFG